MLYWLQAESYSSSYSFMADGVGACLNSAIQLGFELNAVSDIDRNPRPSITVSPLP